MVMSSSSSAVRTYVVIAVVTMTLLLHMDTVSTQQFFTNGRYGRRSSPPQLTESSSGREMLISFFGDNGVKCIHTGYSDLYRCSRLRNSDISEELQVKPLLLQIEGLQFGHVIRMSEGRLARHYLHTKDPARADMTNAVITIEELPAVVSQSGATYPEVYRCQQSDG